MFVTWDESRHPRASDGRFGSVAGTHTGSQQDKVAGVQEKTNQNDLPAKAAGKSATNAISENPSESPAKAAGRTVGKAKSAAKPAKLNQVEKNALYDYSTDKFQEVNNHLRNPGESRPDLDRIVSNVDSAMEKSPTYSGTKYRAFTPSPEQYQAIASQLKEGGTYSDAAYMSTSDRPRGFQAMGKGVISMEIRGNVGADISAVSANPGEREVLIPRGAKFKVASVSHGQLGELKVVLEHSGN